MNHGTIDTSTIEVNGRAFRVEIEQDSDHGAPWTEDYGTGIVSDWRTSYRHEGGKGPGERILLRDGNWARFYDFAGTMAKAKRDGWGLCDKDRAELGFRLGHAPTKGEIVAEAVERDFRRLKGWCDDDWYYVGVIVKDETTGRENALWGIESDDDSYLEATARELADEMFPLAEAHEAAALELATD